MSRWVRIATIDLDADEPYRYVCVERSPDGYRVELGGEAVIAHGPSSSSALEQLAIQLEMIAAKIRSEIPR